MQSAAATTKPSMQDLWAKARVMGKRYYHIVKKYWWIPALTTVIGFSVSAWKGSRIVPTYISSAQMLITGQFQIEGAARIAEAENFLGTQFALITGDQVGKRARARVQTQHPDWIPVPVNVDISQASRTTILILRAAGAEPLYTQAYLDAVMQEYIAFKKEMRVEKSDNMTSAIRNQLILLEKQTNLDEDELIQFQKENNLGAMQEQGNGAGAYLAELDRKLAALKTELNLLNTLNLDQTIDRGQINSQPSNSGNQNISTLDPSISNNYGPITEYQRAKQMLLTLQAKRVEYLKSMKVKNPKITDIDEEIAKAANLMETYRTQSIDMLKLRRESIEYQIKNLQEVSREWSAKAMDLSVKIAEHDRLKLKLERDKNQYDRLITTLRSVDVFKNVEQDPLSIMENASPATPSKESIVKTISGGIAAGLIAGLAILFLIDKSNDKIGSIVECRDNFREHAILGQIPHDEMEGALSLLAPYDPRKALLEAFRALRSSIIFAPVDGTRPKALMITSADHDEGKTTIAANFAATLAFSGARTLLIDCNLTSGHLHELFDTTPDRGLINVLQQQVRWTEAVVQTNIDNLFLLPRGEALAYPAEHFFGVFLKDIYQEFDYIIFDSAPILEDVDALSFAPIVDGVLFVIRFEQTSAAKATRALDFFKARQVNVLGLICNDVA